MTFSEAQIDIGKSSELLSLRHATGGDDKVGIGTNEVPAGKNTQVRLPQIHQPVERHFDACCWSELLLGQRCRPLSTPDTSLDTSPAKQTFDRITQARRDFIDLVARTIAELITELGLGQLSR